MDKHADWTFFDGIGQNLSTGMIVRPVGGAIH
jgi:hypothetical protein